jgi:hypothetical protein
LTNGTGIGLVKSPEVDGEASGSVVISETGDNEEFVPITGSIEFTSASGIIAGATICIGTNSPNFDNILGATSLGLLGVSLPSLPLISIRVPENTEIRVRKITQAVATDYKFIVRLFGNLQS